MARFVVGIPFKNKYMLRPMTHFPHGSRRSGLTEEVTSVRYHYVQKYFFDTFEV